MVCTLNIVTLVFSAGHLSLVNFYVPIFVCFKGIEVYYAGTVAEIPPGNAVIRCMILLWTGDYPAQCEVGKFIKNGVQPCRRCDLKGIFKIILHFLLTILLLRNS